MNFILGHYNKNNQLKLLCRYFVEFRWKICGNMKEYVENTEYPSLYRLWNLKKLRELLLYIGDRTWKNSEHSPCIDSGPLYSLCGVEKFRALPPCAGSRGLRIISREARRQDSKDMRHDLHFLAWLINTFPLLASTNF